ncbi:MAG: DNA replication/repair protein RecF [Chloroflexota bacterium]
MYGEKLNLKDFRNYRQLELGLPRGLVVFEGENAVGKTSLLEALYLLATTKSPRAGTEQELVSLEAEPQFGAPAFARLSAEIVRQEGAIEAEILIIRDGEGSEITPTNSSRKRIKVNGVSRRAVDLIGQINVVLFSPEDLDLIIGAPALRRRYLDITLSQIDHRYLRALQEYSRVLAQRNGFLRNQKERRRAGRGTTSSLDELAIWDSELVKSGVYIIRRRRECLRGLNERAIGLHANLIGLNSPLTDAMQPSFELVYQPSFKLAGVEDEATLTQRFEAQLKLSHTQELQRGVSLIGPHRDDFAFMIEGADIGIYGSRGQQRTAVLALKLAEVGWMENQTGDPPILMLDDILSELDVNRRQYVLETVQVGAEQVLITTTDLALFGNHAHLQQIAALYHVGSGRVTRL